MACHLFAAAGVPGCVCGCSKVLRLRLSFAERGRQVGGRDGRQAFDFTGSAAHFKLVKQSGGVIFAPRTAITMFPRRTAPG